MGVAVLGLPRRAGVGMRWDVGCHFSTEILGVKSRYRGRCARASYTFFRRRRRHVLFG